ncbi:unnamed protein product, partial [marine sediment metagenome]
FILGLAGVVNSYVAWGFVIAVVLWCSRDTKLIARDTLCRLRRAAGRVTPLGAAGAGLAFFAFLALFNVSQLPPAEFDVLEYHLGLPAEYFRSGGTRPLADNVFSFFPALYEMTALFLMQAASGVLAGAMLTKVLNVFLYMALAAAVAAAARRLWGRGAALGGALIFFSLHIGFEITYKSYVENLLAFYAILAIVALVFALKSFLLDRRWLFLSAVSAGFAMGVKYTGVPFVLLPAVLVIAWVGVRRRLGVKQALARAFVYAAIASACAS